MNRPTRISWTPAPATAVPTANGVAFNHAYNKANQRIGQTATDNSWINYPAAMRSTVSYTADALNRYTAVGAVTPTYDGNSNLTSDGTFTLGYDAENRLISAVGAGNTASYLTTRRAAARPGPSTARQRYSSPTPAIARCWNMTVRAARSSAGMPAGLAQTRC